MIAETTTAHTAPRPEDYDYGNPTLNCDMVMKGGITSGIVYPLAVCEIARTYRLRNVGGTSAGAIAAAAAAAAELGRDTGGFRRLAALPRWLGTNANLFNLFQPQTGTRRLYTILTAGIRAGGAPLENIAVAAVRNFPGPTLLGTVPGVALLVLLLQSARGFLLAWGFICAILVAILGAAIILGFAVYREAVSVIRKNFFGLCSGFGEDQAASPALTPWLTAELDILAGKAKSASVTDTQAAEPLTFGDLSRGPAPFQQGGGSVINLEMITTNLTQGRGYRLPFESHVWFFNPKELARLFPERIVRWMVNHPPKAPTGLEHRRRWELLCKLLEPLCPLPDATNLPVVVAARMSLSFPLLISAIPLWSVDWSRTKNEDAQVLWERWLAEQGEAWDSIRDHRKSWKNVPDKCPRADRCWFSDGGITNNFPVNFFDAPIPRWPTFDINLRPFHPDHQETENQCDNVWMPETNEGGIEEWWVPIDSVGTFVRSIFDTLQNGDTNTQLHVPGYRDRIAHIELATSEGGMNLDMPQSIIEKLTERGRCAGEKLSRRFSPPGDGTPLTWDNHRWVRYRSTMQLLQEALGMFYRAYNWPSGAAQSYAALINRAPGVAPESYRWRGPAQQQAAIEATTDVLNWKWSSSGATFADGAPKPEPELRIKPRL